MVPKERIAQVIFLTHCKSKNKAGPLRHAGARESEEYNAYSTNQPTKKAN
jgi:hypothetical protein